MLKVAMTKTINHFRLKVEFEAGSGITGIIGPSGCGKSMTLQCIAGLQTPDHGEIIVNNRPLYQSNNRINIKSRDRNIGYVFQNYALFPHLTVEKNIEYGLQGLTKRERKEKITNMIQKVRLAGYEHHYPSQLSGGQQQRAALARTLVTEPSLLLLDEPFSALDHHVKHILEQELLGIIKENYSGIVLLVTHNMEEAYRLCDSLILYNDGHIIQSGAKEAVFKKPMNVSAAKVIGCQNILPVDSLVERDGHLECAVEGVALRIPQQPITENTKHIGIYAENVRFIEVHGPSHNAYHFHILDVVKGIHQTSVRLKVENSFVLHASIPNHQLPSLLQGKFKVELSPGNLFLLENN